MNFTSIPVWLKAMAAAALGGFATAAYAAAAAGLNTSDDYRKLIHVGIAGAVVALLGYLKASPVSSLPEVPPS